MLCITGQRKRWQNSSVSVATCSSKKTGMQLRGAKTSVIFRCSSGSAVKTPGWPTNFTLLIKSSGKERAIIETTLKLNCSLSRSASAIHSPALDRSKRTGSVRNTAKTVSSAPTCVSLSFFSFFSKLCNLGMLVKLSATMHSEQASPALGGLCGLGLPYSTCRYRPRSSSTKSRCPVGTTVRFSSCSSQRQASEVREQTTYLY
mmetsp:Transcript_4433/g.12412  ORF Transcript_4433/g.12412 Transcript_4433/m.12412 type:complete len:203 (+) Transcript_4433:2538-3146(+)